MNNGNDILRRLPATDALLQTSAARRIAAADGIAEATAVVRRTLEELRREIAAAPDTEATRESLTARAEEILDSHFDRAHREKLQKVINATGVIIHTNLGRAPLSDTVCRAIVENASRYCNLEYDLTTGKRGKRGARAERLLAAVTGAESAVIVNNCAAAAFLVMTVFGAGGEVVISRGELVEIGGDFRVPDVLEQSGAKLREVGTTNRTKISDYENAVNEETKMILRVHPSNYRVVGFTAAPTLAELTALARRKNLIFFEDAGSGAMFDLAAYGLTDEPVISASVAAGVDVVAFSGDKLLGGVQSGLLVGKKDAIEKIRRHPLYRALRVDKIVYAALEAALESLRRGTWRDEIPVLRMIAATKTEIKARTEEFAAGLRDAIGADSPLRFEIVEGNSVIGGGSAPTVNPETFLLALTHEKFSADALEAKLRRHSVPVIARVVDDRIVLDLRTVFADETDELLAVLSEISATEN